MEPGDVVRLRLAHDELDCTILQSHDSSIVLVKLPSGYNIGIPKDHILGSRVLKKVENASLPQITLNRSLPAIGLLVTGGTIASKLDPRTGGASSLASIEEFVRFHPRLFDMVYVKRIAMPFMKLSENIEPSDWIVMAEHVHEMLLDPEIKGVIVTHGTDTLQYTAAALSFFLKPSKPVVITYAQRSIDRGSSDADLNLRCAARAALSDVAEVMLVGHANLNDDFCYALRGTKFRKLHTSRRDAFKPVNTGPIAHVWPEKMEVLSHYTSRSVQPSEIDALFSEKVALVKVHPGFDPRLLEMYQSKGYKALVLEVYGLGNLPSTREWQACIKKLINEGMILSIAAQTIYGRVNANVYSTGRLLLDAGVIPLDDMLSETAFVKLGWLLGHKSWKADTIKDKLTENIAGEFSGILNA